MKIKLKGNEWNELKNKSISDDNTTIKATVQKIENFYWLREWHSCAMNVVGNKKRTVAVILS